MFFIINKGYDKKVELWQGSIYFMKVNFLDP